MLVSWCSQEQFLIHLAMEKIEMEIDNNVNEKFRIWSGVDASPLVFGLSASDVNASVFPIVKRDEIEELVRELMHGEKGKEMRKNRSP
ncbi:hypothetical protein AgCh_035029 [Apium graveolens]